MALGTCCFLLLQHEAPAAETAPRYQAPGTKFMIETLQDWERAVGSGNPFADYPKIKSLKEKLAVETNAKNRVNMLAELGKQFLNLGRVEDSLNIMTNLLQAADIQLYRAKRAGRNQVA